MTRKNRYNSYCRDFLSGSLTDLFWGNFSCASAKQATGYRCLASSSSDGRHKHWGRNLAVTRIRTKLGKMLHILTQRDGWAAVMELSGGNKFKWVKKHGHEDAGYLLFTSRVYFSVSCFFHPSILPSPLISHPGRLPQLF